MEICRYYAESPDRFIVDGSDIIENLGTVFELLDLWLSKATSDGSELEELTAAKNSGRLPRLITLLKTKIEGLQSPRLSTRLEEIERKVQGSSPYFG